VKILVVDDMKSFPFPETTEVVYARTLADGLKELDSRDYWDELWLDHDLGGWDDIRPLVRVLEERAHEGKQKDVGLVVVCSLNGPGARWIIDTLQRYYPVARCMSPKQAEGFFQDRKPVWY
jgi:hypothetical protein